MQYIKSRNWKMKEGKYTKSVAKFQGGAIFHMRDQFGEYDRDDLWLSNTTGILQEKKKKNFVVYWC